MTLRLLACGRTGRRTAIPARTVETPRTSSVNLFKRHTTRCGPRRPAARPVTPQSQAAAVPQRRTTAACSPASNWVRMPELTAGERSGVFAMGGTLSTPATCAWATPGHGRVPPGPLVDDICRGQAGTQRVLPSVSPTRITVTPLYMSQVGCHRGRQSNNKFCLLAAWLVTLGHMPGIVRCVAPELFERAVKRLWK